MTSSDRERALDVLIAKDEIREALARYCRGIDRRDEALVRSAYHPEARDTHGYGLTGTGYDLAAVARRDNPQGFPTAWIIGHHFVGNMLIEVDGESAVSETYFQGWSRSEHEGVPHDLISFGRYLDRWERRPGVGFRIIERTVIYDYTRTDPIATVWPGPDHDVPKMFWGGPELTTAETVFGSLSAEDESYRLLGFVSDREAQAATGA